MSDNNAQLKSALVSAIKEKKIKILESNKILLKTIEEGIDSKINSVSNNRETVESLDIETLARIFTSLEVPCYTSTQINILEKIFDFFNEKENSFLCDLLNRAINEFVVNRFAGKPQDHHPYGGFVNSPFTQFGSQRQPSSFIPSMPDWNRFNAQGVCPQPNGLKQPPVFNPALNPQRGFTDIHQGSPFQSNFNINQSINEDQGTFNPLNQKTPNESKDEQVSSNKTSTTEISFKNLLSELRRFYQNVADQEIGDELLSELNSVLEGFEKLQPEPNMINFTLVDLQKQLKEITEKIKVNEWYEPWNDLEFFNNMISSKLSDYKKP